MKKTLLILALIAAIATGCAEVDSEPVIVNRFKCVGNASNWDIVVDSETGVMYAVSRGMYNMGTVTLLVDAEGNPLIWEETGQ
ncbi:MAG: hypothetical protein J6M46_03300 [Lachnospiraceae bacterium]|nr:hypothetical protein [Lachnospiraceae bacterium]